MGKSKKKKNKKQQQQPKPGQNVTWYKAGDSGAQGGGTSSARLISPWETGMSPAGSANFQGTAANSYGANPSRSGGSSFEVSLPMNQTFNQGYTSTNNDYGLANEKNCLMNKSFNQGYESTGNASGYGSDMITSGYDGIGRSYEGKQPMDESLNHEYNRARKTSGYESSSSNFNLSEPSKDGKVSLNQSFNQGYTSTNASKPDSTSRPYGVGSTNEGKNEKIQPVNQSPSSNAMRPMNQSVNQGPNNDMPRAMNQLVNQLLPVNILCAMSLLANQLPINLIRPMIPPIGQGSANNVIRPMIPPISQGSANNVIRPMNQPVNKGSAKMMQPGNQGSSNMMHSMNQSGNQGSTNMMRSMNQPGNQGSTNMMCSMNQPGNQKSTNMMCSMNQPGNQGSSNMMRSVNQPGNQGSTNMMHSMNQPGNQGSSYMLHSMNQSGNQGSTNMMHSMNQPGNQESTNMMYSMNQPGNQGSTNMMRSMNQPGNQGSSNRMLSMNEPTNQRPTKDSMLRLVNQGSINEGMYPMNQAISQGPTTNNNRPMNQSVNQSPVKMIHSVTQDCHGPTNNMMRSINQVVQGPTNNVMHSVNQVGQGLTNNIMNQIGQGPANNMMRSMNQVDHGPDNNMMSQVNQGLPNDMINQMNQVSQEPTNMIPPMNHNYGLGTLKNSTDPEFRGGPNFQRGSTHVPPSNYSAQDSTCGIPSLMDLSLSTDESLSASQTQRVGSLWENQYRLDNYRSYDLNRVSERTQAKSLVARLQQRTLLSRLQERSHLNRLQQRSSQTKSLFQLPKKGKKKGKKKPYSTATTEAKGKSEPSSKSEKKYAPKPDRPSERREKVGKENKNTSVSGSEKEEKGNKNASVSNTSIKKQKEAVKRVRAIIYPGSVFHCPYCGFNKFRSAHNFKKHVQLFYHKEIAEAYFAKMAAGEEYLKASAKLSELRNCLDSEGNYHDKELESIEQRVFKRATKYPRCWCCRTKFPNRRKYDEHIGSIGHFKTAYKVKLERESKLKEMGRTLKPEKKEKPLSGKKKKWLQNISRKFEETEESIDIKDPEEVKRIVSLLKEARKNAEETPLNEDTIPIFEQSKSIGLEFIKESLNFRCTVCKTRVPDLEHCNSIGHYESIVNRLNEIKEESSKETTSVEDDALKETAEGKKVFMDDTVKEIFLDDAVEEGGVASPITITSSPGGASPRASPITITSSPGCPMDTSDVCQNDEADEHPSSNDIQADSQCFSIVDEVF